MKYYLSVFVVALSLCGLSATAEAHQHLTAGVNSSGTLVLYGESNNPLDAVNPATYHMVWTPSGENYGGYYALGESPRDEYPNDYFSFIALSDGQTQEDGPNHAPTGADIWMEISSVSGPLGANFGFWDSNRSKFFTTPTESFAADGSPIDFQFQISEPLEDVEPEDQDPFGHVHNRGFTVDQIGDYYVTFKLYDLSELGEGGTPLAGSSQSYTFHFVAVPEPSSWALSLLALGLIFLARYRRVKLRAEAQR